MPKKNLSLVSGPRVARLASFALALSTGVANAQTAQFSAPDSGREGPSGLRSVRGFAGLSVVYSQILGSEFDGRHANLFDAEHIAFLPKLSGGFGIRPSAGVLLQQVLPSLSVSTAVNLEYSKHQAISYNVGNSWYDHEDAKFYDLSLELRGMLEVGRFRPFVGVAPGYAWLSLPNGVTVTTISSPNVIPSTSWSDITLRGFSFEASAGLLYEFFTFLAAEAQFGFRLHGLTASSEGSLNGFGYSPGWFASLGAVGML